MTITFTPTGGSAVTVAGTGREGSEGLRLGFEDAVQVARPLRSAEAVQYNRGGRLFRLTWSTTRAHADQATADAFAVDHAVEIASLKTGALLLAGTLTLTSATVAITELVILGTSTRTSYAASGVFTPAS